MIEYATILSRKSYRAILGHMFDCVLIPRFVFELLMVLKTRLHYLILLPTLLLLTIVESADLGHPPNYFLMNSELLFLILFSQYSPS